MNNVLFLKFATIFLLSTIISCNIRNTTINHTSSETQKNKATVKIAAPGMNVGVRSIASIQRVVVQNLSAIRNAYRNRLEKKPGISGNVTFKFNIDESGKVVSCRITASTIKDSVLEKTIANQIILWQFEKINDPGNTTEITYPFSFSY